MRTIVISQPAYLPWTGYFRVMKEADVYVFLDDVQFERRSWQCRNRVKSPEKWIWLTVPTYHKRSLIENVEIDNTKPWRRKHWMALKTCYGKAPYFDVYSPFFMSVFKEESWTRLASLDIHIIKYLASQLTLFPVFLRSSELGVEGKRTKLLLNICKLLEGDRYVSSIGAEEYMKQDGAKELFGREGIEVEFLEYNQAKYPQRFGDFLPNMSFVDCLFNCGPDSEEIVFHENSAILHSIGE